MPVHHVEKTKSLKGGPPAGGKRAVIRLQLDVGAKNALDNLCEKRGMTQISVLSRVVRWFGRQDEVVQASVLGLMGDELLGQLAPRLLQQIQERGEKGGR